MIEHVEVHGLKPGTFRIINVGKFLEQNERELEDQTKAAPKKKNQKDVKLDKPDVTMKGIYGGS